MRYSRVGCWLSSESSEEALRRCWQGRVYVGVQARPFEFKVPFELSIVRLTVSRFVSPGVSSLGALFGVRVEFETRSVVREGFRSVLLSFKSVSSVAHLSRPSVFLPSRVRSLYVSYRGTPLYEVRAVPVQSCSSPVPATSASRAFRSVLCPCRLSFCPPEGSDLSVRRPCGLAVFWFH